MLNECASWHFRMYARVHLSRRESSACGGWGRGGFDWLQGPPGDFGIDGKARSDHHQRPKERRKDSGSIADLAMQQAFGRPPIRIPEASQPSDDTREAHGLDATDQPFARHKVIGRRAKPNNKQQHQHRQKGVVRHDAGLGSAARPQLHGMDQSGTDPEEPETQRCCKPRLRKMNMN